VSLEVVGIIGLALVAVVLAVRNGGLRAERSKAEERASRLEAQLQTTMREFTDYRTRMRAQLDSLHADIETLESDLANCSSPGSRRARLERLLSKARHRADGQG
jgi:type II secretory pathway pseudopilin PulG